jgi:hypothetical protein
MLASSNIPRPYIRHSSQSGLPECNGQSYHPSSQTAFVGAFLKQVLKFEPGSRERRWDIVFHGTPPENVTSIVSDGFKLPDECRALRTLRERDKLGVRIILFPIRNLQSSLWLRLQVGDCIRIPGVSDGSMPITMDRFSSAACSEAKPFLAKNRNADSIETGTWVLFSRLTL